MPKLNIRRADLVLLMVIATLILISWQGLSGPFVFDDHPNLSPISKHTPPNYGEFIFSNEAGFLGRSVSMATFALNHKLRGDFYFFDVKVTNLAVHILNAILLYVIVITLLNSSRESESGSWIALLVVSLWMLTPLNTGVIFYAVQRMAMLATFFVFAGILCYLRWRLNPAGSQTTRRVYLALAVACWPLAFLAKENGVLLPLLILPIEFGFLATGKQFAMLRLSFVALLLGGCIGIGILDSYGLLSYSDRSFTLSERLLTEPVAISHYVRDLLVPMDADIGLFNDDFPVRSSFWNVASLSAGTLIVLALGLCLSVSERSPYRAVSAGLLFFFGAHSVESTAIALEIYFEHRNYLPSAGLYLSLALGLNEIVASRPSFRPFAVVAAILITVWFTTLSYHKAAAWQSWPHVVANLYTYHPTSLRAGLEMSSLLMNANNFDAAVAINEQNATYNPTRLLNIQLQKLYLYCESGVAIPKAEYEALHGGVSSGNELGNVTAFEILINAKETKNCANLDLDKVVGQIASMVDLSLREKSITPKQAWHLEYFIIEHARLNHRLDEARARLRRSINSGNLKATFYAQDVFRLDATTRERNLDEVTPVE